ncbi:MAG: SDR family oxidoreductase [Deltaproteobacteria bacterium]|nr:SDR family oxidoreductase [Deltaproteobacteria bacterium]
MRAIAEQVHLVTGATQGIGKETARALARLGARVIVTARDQARGTAVVDELRADSGNQRVELALVDFASFRSVRAFLDEVRARVDRLDVLVNNAGGYFQSRQETEDGHEMSFQVNHLGYFMTTLGLFPQLRAGGSARVVCVSSDAHWGGKVRLDDLDRTRGYAAYGAYAASKLMNLLFTVEAARRFPSTIAINGVHPGVVASGFGLGESGVIKAFYRVARPLLRTSQQGADTPVWLATAPELDGVTGKYWARRQERGMRAAARDKELARRLWEESERLTGVSLPADG